MELALLIVYGALLLFIFTYSLVQLSLAINYLKGRHVEKAGPGSPENALPEDGKLPIVCVQLPVFNERYVVERLINAVAELDYPKDKLEIQILDDSTDDSVELAAARVAHFRNLGFRMEHIRRENRSGFKAGALAYGLERTGAAFIAIFDADFIPDPAFLRRTLPFLLDEPGTGMVQTRWKHINENYSLLTKLQAFGLDGHFVVEQIGRNRGGHFINFNGTAGIWRKQCIIDSGGWSSDTLTEDLDLSYRAQLKDWKFRYLPDVGSPSELPAEMNSLKSQQYRWTKGAAECAVKNLPKVLKARKIGFRTKVHALFHLLNSFIFICVLGTALLSVPLLLLKPEMDEFATVFKLASIFLLSFLVLGVFYWISRPREEHRGILAFLGFLWKFPLFLSVSMGLSLHNAIAVLEGYFGRKTPFVRTPKFGIANKGDSWTDKQYRALRMNPLALGELLLAAYFVFGIYMAFRLSDYGLLPFHAMLSFGFFYVAFQSIIQLRASR